MKYCPITVEEQKTLTGKLNPAPYVRIMNLIDQKYPQDERGDLLIFLSGMTEISIVEEAAKVYADKTGKWIILPLHSTLSLEEQDKVYNNFCAFLLLTILLNFNFVSVLSKCS